MRLTKFYLAAGFGETFEIMLRMLSEMLTGGDYLTAQIPVNGTTDFYTVETRYRECCGRPGAQRCGRIIDCLGRAVLVVQVTVTNAAGNV